MSISVIIPTRNAGKYMWELLTNLTEQKVHIEEIIVIDTASSDDTKEICSKFEKVKFIPIKNGEFNHGGTRNRAAREANGDVLVFMTQDARPKNTSFIDELTKELGQNNIVASYGRQEAREDAEPLEKFARQFNYGDKNIVKSQKDLKTLGIKTFFFTNVCSAFLKNEFWKVGGFPEKIIMNEDMIIASKLIFSNKNILYSSKAVVIHSHQYNYMQQFKRNFDVGVVFTDSEDYFHGVKSESEGIKFVKSAAKHLMDSKKGYLLPHLIIDSGFKFIGYKLGQNYKKMPLSLVKKLSMHSFYFDSK